MSKPLTTDDTCRLQTQFYRRKALRGDFNQDPELLLVILATTPPLPEELPSDQSEGVIARWLTLADRALNVN